MFNIEHKKQRVLPSVRGSLDNKHTKLNNITMNICNHGAVIPGYVT